MQRPLQPQFKIRVFNLGISGDSERFYNSSNPYSSDGKYLDIEEFVGYPINIDFQASLLNTLTFTIIKNSEVIVPHIHIGKVVKMYASDGYNDNLSGMRKVFTGTIVKCKTTYADNGKIMANVTCMNYGYNQLGKDHSYYVYPDEKSERAFAKGKKEITIQEIVEGICNDSGVQIGEISIKGDTKLTKKKSRRQKGVTDWAFLNYLAKCYGCSCWLESVDGVEKLFFVDKSQVRHTVSKEIGFVYMSEAVKQLRDSERKTFLTDGGVYTRPRILREVSLEEDVSMAYSVTRSAQYFDKETGEQKEGIASTVLKKTKEGDVEIEKMLVEFYELDEDKVALVDKTNPGLAEAIRNMEPGGLKGWSSDPTGAADENDPHYTKYYYRKKQVVEENIAVFDQAFRGITVTATCVMDLDIKPQRAYPIRGLIRYNSKSSTEWYYLQGLTYNWDTSGPTMTLNFIM